MNANKELERLARQIDALPPNLWNKLASVGAKKLIAIHDSAATLDEKRDQVAEFGRGWAPATKHSMAQDASFRLMEMMGIVEGRGDDMRAKLDGIRPPKPK